MNYCRCGCGTPTKNKWARGHHWSAKHDILTAPNPSGLCKCGCGGTTKIAKFTDPKRGVLKGHRINFIMSHQSRVKRGAYGPYKKTRELALAEQPNPSGLCWCGCGGETPLAKATSRRDSLFLGYPVRYLPHHAHRPTKPMYIVEDRGYKTPCWIWQWHCDQAGYGKVSREGKSQPAHRWMYRKMKGAIPHGRHLDHLCFQPPCINPDHLEPVTPAVNNDRRRYIKLSPEKAVVIRQLHDWGAHIDDIAKLFGVRAPNIWRILAGLSWRPRIIESEVSIVSG